MYTHTHTHTQTHTHTHTTITLKVWEGMPLFLLQVEAKTNATMKEPTERVGGMFLCVCVCVCVYVFLVARLWVVDCPWYCGVWGYGV